MKALRSITRDIRFLHFLSLKKTINMRVIAIRRCWGGIEEVNREGVS